MGIAAKVTGAHTSTVYFFAQELADTKEEEGRSVCVRPQGQDGLIRVLIGKR